MKLEVICLCEVDGLSEWNRKIHGLNSLILFIVLKNRDKVLSAVLCDQKPTYFNNGIQNMPITYCMHVSKSQFTFKFQMLYNYGKILNFLVQIMLKISRMLIIHSYFHIVMITTFIYIALSALILLVPYHDILNQS
jgi:hypothetical protein